MIKAIMEKGGHYITLPPDTTPIHSIPYSPPAKDGGEEGRPLDWEGLRAYIQSGGRVDLHPKSK